MGKIYYSWDQVTQLTAKLVRMIQPNIPIAIVGVARGGLIPAVMMAHLFKIKNMQVIHASSYNEENQHEDLSVFVDSKAQEVLRDPRTIIVDDIIDSGRTKNLIKFTWPKPQYYALITKQPDQIDRAAALVPLGTWVVFPWESRNDE